MSKIDLDTIATGFNLTKINSNFQKIEDDLNNKVLYRDNIPNEPNYMLDTLDMNGQRIINLPAPLNNNEPVRLQDVTGLVAGTPTASLVAFVPYLDVSSTNVQGAIQELKDDINAVIGGTPSAASVSFAPFGNVSSTNVQSAIQELDSEKAKLAGDVAQPFSASTLAATTVNATTANVTTVNSVNENVSGLFTAPTSLLTSVNGRTSGGRVNSVINGSFDDWPLGDSITIANHLQKVANRWNYDWNGTLGTINISRSPTSLSNVPLSGNFSPRNTARVRCLSAPSGNTFQDFSTQIESVLTYAGQQITISFYAFSLVGGNKDILVKTEQYFGGPSGSAPVFNTSSPVNISSSVWQRYSVTFNMASVTGKTLGTNGDDTLNIIFTLPLNQTFDLLFGGVQVESGPIATPYEYRQQSETASDCERYIVSSYDPGVVPGTVTNAGAISFIQHGTADTFTIQLPTRMRSTPFVKLYNPITGALGTWNNAGSPVTVAVNTNGTRNVTIALTGGTAGNFCTGHYVIEDPYY